MDQIKIGRFIAESRKKEALTQMQLAEKLGITDRAVSKWETGKCMPDSAIMLELCDILKITVNDLLCGEAVPMENYNKELENNLLEMVKQKEKTDKRMLLVEVIMIVVCILPILGATLLVSLIPMEETIGLIVELASIVPSLIALPFMLKIEQIAGYYKCTKCGHMQVPTCKSVFWAMHLGRTRYIRCAACGKKSWHKKVVSKE